MPAEVIWEAESSNGSISVVDVGTFYILVRDSNFDIIDARHTTSRESALTIASVLKAKYL